MNKIKVVNNKIIPFVSDDVEKIGRASCRERV